MSAECVSAMDLDERVNELLESMEQAADRVAARRREREEEDDEAETKGLIDDTGISPVEDDAEELEGFAGGEDAEDAAAAAEGLLEDVQGLVDSVAAAVEEEASAAGGEEDEAAWGEHPIGDLDDELSRLTESLLDEEPGEGAEEASAAEAEPEPEDGDSAPEAGVGAAELETLAREHEAEDGEAEEENAEGAAASAPRAAPAPAPRRRAEAGAAEAAPAGAGTAAEITLRIALPEAAGHWLAAMAPAVRAGLWVLRLAAAGLLRLNGMLDRVLGGHRGLVGIVALWTVLLAAVVWGALLLRSPEKPTPQSAPVGVEGAVASAGR